MKQLTVNEIREKLGLKDHSDFQHSAQMFNRYSRYIDNSIEKNRQTGRTTEMILTAIAVVQNTKVIIVAHSLAASKVIEDQTKDYCKRLGILTHSIQFMTKELYLKSLIVNKLEDKAIFVDHLVKGEL